MTRTTHRSVMTPVTIVILLIALAGATFGCRAQGLAQVRRDLERQLPGAHFEKDIELSLGPVSLAFARLFTRMVPDARQASGYLRDVNRIEMAVYEADWNPSDKNVPMPRRLQDLEESEDWEMAVRVRDENELAWILYRIENDRIKELYVVILDRDELVMVRAEGRLEGLLARALNETGTVKGIAAEGLTMNDG